MGDFFPLSFFLVDMSEAAEFFCFFLLFADISVEIKENMKINKIKLSVKSWYYNEYWSKYLYSNNKYIISHYNWKDIDCNLLQGTHWNTWKLFNHMLYGHFFALPRVIDYKMYTQVTNWRKSLEDEGKTMNVDPPTHITFIL